MFLDWETGPILCLDCAFEVACAKRGVNTNPSDGLVNEPTCGNQMIFLSDFARPLGKPPNDDENISYDGLLARAEIYAKACISCGKPTEVRSKMFVACGDVQPTLLWQSRFNLGCRLGLGGE